MRPPPIPIVPFAGLFSTFISLLVAIGDPLVYILHKIKPELVPVEKFGFFNLRLIIFVLKNESLDNIGSDEYEHVSVGNLEASDRLQKAVSEREVRTGELEDNFFEGLKLAVYKKDGNRQISYFEEALKKGLSQQEELIARSFLMNAYANNNEFDQANAQAKIMKDTYKNIEVMLDFKDNPAEALFLHECRLIPFYPDNIREDLPEEERKKAALDSMQNYHDFMGPQVLNSYLGECYYRRGNIEFAISEIRKGIGRFAELAEFPLEVIFRSRLGTLYNIKGNLQPAKEEFSKAIKANSLVDDNWFPTDEIHGKRMREGLEFWLNIAIQSFNESK